MSTLLASLADVLVDNPIVAKDASLVLRRRRTIAVWLLATCAIAVISAFVVLDGSRSLRWYGTLNPIGDDLLTTICGIALGAVSVLVPALASSSIAGEREQGTLPLLLVTGLSPLRIVVGKLVAVLVVVAPFVALALPPLGYCTVLLGVDTVDVGLAFVGIVAATIAAASVGVYVSAVTSRARAAAPGALLASAVPAFFCAMPAFVTVSAIGNDLEGRPIAVGGVVMAGVITVVAIYGAWSALAPRLTPRFGLATRLAAGVMVALSAAAVVLIRSCVEDDLSVAIIVPALVVLAMTAFVYTTTAASDRRTPPPILVVGGAMLAFFASVTVVTLAMPDLHERNFSRHHLESLVVAVLHVAAASGIAGLVARLRRGPVLAGIVGAGSVFMLMMITPLVDEIGDADVVAFLNFATVDNDSFASAIAFWTVLAVGSAVLASFRRPQA